MLSLPPGIQVFMAIEPVDMRKSFDGLSAAVQAVFARDVLDGHLFLFLNRRRDRLKILWWDRDGLAIYYKRLERGAVRFPSGKSDQENAIAIDRGELLRLLSGLEIVARRAG